MPEIRTICQWCWRRLIILIALLVISLALVFSIIRLTLPLLSDWKTELENVATSKLGYQVDIEDINVSWQKFYPRVHFVNATVNDKTENIFFIGELILSVDILRSLFNLEFKLNKVTVINTSFDLLRDKNNLWYLNKQLVNKETGQNKEIYIPKQLKGIVLTALNSQLHFKDEIEKKEHTFDGLSASATNRSDRYQLFISSNIPSPLGNRFDVGIDVKGDINQPENLKGQAYVNLNEIDIKKILPWLQNVQPIERGVFSGQFWFDIGDKKQDFFAQLQAEKVKINTAKIKDKAFSTIQTEFEKLEIVGLFKRENDQYQAYLPLVKFLDEEDKEAAVFSDNLLLSITVANQSLSEVERFRVSYDEVSLETMQKLISLMPVSKFKAQLEKASLLGFIKDGFIDCQNLGNRIGCAGKSYFEKINYSAGEKKPSLLGFSGKVIYRDGEIYAKHESKNITVGLPDFFIKPLVLTSLKASSWIDLNNGDVIVRQGQAVADKSEVNFALDIDIKKEQGKYDKKNSRIRLLADGKNIIATEAKYYLPLKQMPPSLKVWLESAFKDGLVKKGAAVVNCTFENYKPNSDNTWQIKASGESVDLQFDPEWPIVEDIAGDFLINNNGLLLNAKEANISGVAISHAYAWLNDFEKPVLHLDLAGQGKLSNLVNFVKQSPLSKDYRNVLNNTSVAGQQKTAVSLAIPFSDVKTLSVDAEVVLEKARLHEKIIDLHVTDIPAGKRLYISEAAFVTDPFSALFNKHAADFSISTALDGRSNLASTNIRVATRLPAEDFWPDHSVTKPAWLNSINGMSNYFISLGFPINAKSISPRRKLSNRQKYPVVTISSDLLDTEFQFPAPLNKSATTKNDLTVGMLLLPDNKIYTDFTIGQYAKGKLNTEFDDGRLKINAAHLVVNDQQEPTVRDKQGIHVEGKLQNINVDKWLDYIESQSTEESGQDSILDLLRSVKLDVASFDYLGRNISKVKTTIQQRPQNWLIGLDSAAVKGEIDLPKSNVVEKGISARFDYVDMNAMPVKAKNDKALNPKEVPHFQIGFGRFKIKDYIFDNVELQTSRTLHGIRIESLLVNNPNLLIDMQGSWISLPDGNSETNIAGKLVTENLGEGLQSIGYAKLIKEGYGNIDFSFHWPDSPVDFSLENIVGEAKGVFEKGEVLSLDPGAGRLFSLISLNKLPKRLLFDFKDVDTKGYYFRKMSGGFTFENGIATTDDFKMRSSIGKIFIEGDTNLTKQTYDQKLRFLPDLSATLPVVGTILGGGATGVGILVLDGVARLFGKQLDNIGEQKYTITGSWDEPKIENVFKKRNRKKKETQEPASNTP